LAGTDDKPETRDKNSPCVENRSLETAAPPHAEVIGGLIDQCPNHNKATDGPKGVRNTIMVLSDRVVATTNLTI